MTYSTLMVYLELEHSNDLRLQIAGDLAERFHARLIGIAAADPQPGYYAGEAFAHGLVDRERSQIQGRMVETEERFRFEMQHRACDIEWRSAMARPIDYVSQQARAADLVITGANRDGLLLDPLRRLDPSDLVMQAGRPVFVVPPEAECLKLKNALVAWKDTREARRAVADALPLLRKADEINIVEVIENSSDRTAARTRVDDVTAWLNRHDVTALGSVLHATSEAEKIDTIRQCGPDFVVAGAYGHTRMREWLFGGFTQTLLTRSRHCSFLAH
jgi:nucleotide-binding universal stress UspA family protein